jgi:uncharacterized SAM-dependent methyltransferase
MHLRSLRAQSVSIARSACTVNFAEGETIWTESSHKYGQDEPAKMAERAGFRQTAQWIDEQWAFAQNLWIVE